MSPTSRSHDRHDPVHCRGCPGHHQLGRSEKPATALDNARNRWYSEVMDCGVDGCGRAIFCRGWCNAHYQRWKRHGDPLGAPVPHSNIVWQWIRAHVASGPHTDECVDAVGVGSLLGSGYREVKMGGQRYLLHRLVCEAAYGPPPTPRHQAAHSCGARACQTLLHLRWATQAENEADKVLHGTHNRGERNPGVKLSDAEVARIRTLWLSTTGVTQREIGDRFNVSQQTISKITNGKSRKHS